MTTTVTLRGDKEFTEAMLARLSTVTLVDADGREITGWGYGALPIDKDQWTDGTYTPGFHWIFISTPSDRPQVIAGAAFTNAAGDPLVFKPLAEPYTVKADGDTLSLNPYLRLYGTVR